MDCASAACKPLKYRKGKGGDYKQEFVLTAKDIFEPYVTAIYGEPEDSDDEFDYLRGKKKPKAIMNHNEDDYGNQKMFARSFIDKTREETVDIIDG